MRSTYLPLLLLILMAGCCGKNNNEVTFSVIGDMPYGIHDEQKVLDIISNQNSAKDVSFMVHVGDIKEGDDPCDFYYYDRFRDILKTSKVPVFAIPGDNEWTDCENQAEAYQTWEQLLTYNLDAQFGGSPFRQEGLPSNFAFLKNKFLFIGLTVPDADEEDYENIQEVLNKDIDWLKDRVVANGSSVDGLVIFAHATPTKDYGFRTRLFSLVKEYYKGKPVVWVQGDDHELDVKHKWKGSGITKVTVGQDDRVKIKITSSSVSVNE